jgi:vacuolar-type H+-ATPase catalytic subunit A/Vma1
MSSKTVYGLLKEARDLMKKSFYSLYPQEFEEFIDDAQGKLFYEALDKLETALNSLETDENIYKHIKNDALPDASRREIGNE